MITFLSPYTQGQGWEVTSLAVALSSNPSGSVMLAVVNVLRTDGGGLSPVLTAPSGWIKAIDNGSFGIGVYRAVWYKLGDGSSGNTTWRFDTNIRGQINIVPYDQINTTTPIDVTASFHNDFVLSTTHTASGVTTVTNEALLVGCYFSADTGISFLDSSDLPNTRVSLAGIGAERATLIADAIQGVAGASGNKSATTNSNSLCQEILVALRPAPNPSISSVVFANGGEQLTAGATVTLQCTAATSPTVAQSSLRYEFSYSANNGNTWTVIGTSAAGVTTKTWVVPATIGSGYLIRVRAFDGTLFSLAYGVSASTFSVVTETAPGKPVITAPTAGSNNLKSATLPVAWAYQGGAGNPQTKYTLKWSRDNFASHTVTIGPVTSGAQTANIDVSAEADGATISSKVLTTGVTLDSGYSAVISFVVASAPAAPNITAPTAGAPPNQPLPTITFTESSAFRARKTRVVRSGTEEYNSGEVVSTVLSFVSDFAFQNGVSYTLFLSVKNSYGFSSTEDSETFTPSYSGPATPTVLYTLVPTDGYILIGITNSDTPSYNEVWRRISGEAKALAIKVGAALPKNVSFADDNVISGVSYIYFARAYSGAGLFTDSADSSVQSITLGNLFVHAVSRSNTNSNALGNAVSLLSLADSAAHGYNESAGVHKMLGRAAPVMIYGQAVWERISVQAAIPFAQESTLNDLFTIWRAQTPSIVVCARDNLGNRIFGRMSRPKITDEINLHTAAFEIEQTRYSEGL